MLAALRQTSVAEIVVVEGAHRLEPPAGVVVVRCEEWRRGPGASLRRGLAALARESERAVVVLADGPALDPCAVERVLAATDPVAAATYDGTTRSHPVALARSVWATIPDEGGRALEPTLVDCRDLRPPGDLDVRSL